jgi:hypothetical protein
MTLYQSTNLNPFKMSPAAGEWGTAWNEVGTVTLTPNTGDTVELFIIPAGTSVHLLSIQNASLGSAAPVSFGLQPTDGSTGNATAFVSAYAAGTATAAGSTYDILFGSPVLVEVDSFLFATFGTVTTGASGALTARVAGNLRGVK